MDDVCPITATRYSVKDLNLPITKPWRPWYTPDSEVIDGCSEMDIRKRQVKFRYDVCLNLR